MPEERIFLLPTLQQKLYEVFMLNIQSSFRVAKAALLAAGIANVGQASTLSWDPSPSPDVTKYEVCNNVISRFNMPNPGVYPSCFELPSTTLSVNVDSVVRPGLNAFALKAINASGLKSDFSNEVSINCDSVCTPSVPVRIRLMTDSSNTQQKPIVIIGENAKGVPLIISNEAALAGYTVFANNPGEVRAADNSFWLMSKLGDKAAIQNLDARGVVVGSPVTAGPFTNNTVITGDRSAESGYGGLLLQNTKNEIVPLPLNTTGTRLYPPPATTYNPFPNTAVAWKSYQLLNDGSQMAFGTDLTGKIGYLVKWDGGGTAVPLKSPALSVKAVIDLNMVSASAGMTFMNSLAANPDGSAVRLAIKDSNNKIGILNLYRETLTPAKITYYGPYPGVVPVGLNRGSAGTAQFILNYAAGNSSAYPAGSVAIWNLNANDQNTGTTRYAPAPASAMIVAQNNYSGQAVGVLVKSVPFNPLPERPHHHENHALVSRVSKLSSPRV
jgi:hypothetical protein